jgi:hypothetical protein
MGRLVGLRLKLGKAREAAQSYQQLSSRGSKSASSVGVLARLIRATAAAGDAATAEALQRELPAAPSTAGLDVGTLEDSSRAVGGGVRRELHRKREATDAGDEEQPKVGDVYVTTCGGVKQGLQPEDPAWHPCSNCTVEGSMQLCRCNRH